MCKFQIFPCSIHEEIPKNPLFELCEKRSKYGHRKKGKYNQQQTGFALKSVIYLIMAHYTLANENNNHDNDTIWNDVSSQNSLFQAQMENMC